MSEMDSPRTSDDFLYTQHNGCSKTPPDFAKACDIGLAELYFSIAPGLPLAIEHV